jgi:oligoribonuclease NrnB/cAMP/cGMP phosphodiesterase (DHH superfamily)
MKMNSYICYHHNDLDGICSAAIIKFLYPYTKFIPVDYGYQYKNEDVEGKNVFVVDFSFNDMDKLAEKANHLVWIDHHKSAMERQPKAWASKRIAGIRSLEYAGCELTWKYYSGLDAPLVVQYIGDMDMWEFELDATKTICEYMNVVFKDPEDAILQGLIRKNDMAILGEIMSKGEALLEAKQVRIEQNFKNGKNIVLWDKIFRLINTNHDISATGEYVYKMDDYDGALMWFADDGIVRCSMRSNGKVDVRLIAESFGGGGHPNAAGFELRPEQFMKLWGIVE